MMRRRLGLALATAALGATVFAPGAFAAHQNCWGVVSQQLAQYSGGIGEHASSQSSPRLGLGNAARAFLGEDAKVYDLGVFLASIDGIDETACP